MLLKELLHKYQSRILIYAAAVLLMADVLGQTLNWNYAIKLMPIIFTLIAVGALLTWGIPSRTKGGLAMFAVILGYVVEVIRVHATNNLTYGDILGFKPLGSPLFMGIMWFLVTLSIWHIVNFGYLNNIYKFILAGVLIVMFNLILEQFGTTYNLWAWRGGQTPLLSYVFWLVISELLFYLYYRFANKFLPNIFIATLLPIMALFFWLMLLVR